MVGEIAGSITALNAAFNLAKNIAQIADTARRTAQANELLAQINAALENANAAHRAQSAQLEEISSLKAEVSQLKAWDTTEQSYEFQEVGAGIVACVRKPDADQSKYPEKVCPNCFDDRHIAPLQQQLRAGRRTFLTCHRCGLELNLTGGHEPTPPTVQRGGSWTSSRRRGGLS